MRRLVAHGFLLLLLIVTACGQIEPVLLAVSMPECTYQGPTRMEEGEVSLSLTLNGLGNARLLLVEVTGDRTDDELQTALELFTDRNEVPDWLRPVIDLELRDAQGIEGTNDTSRLSQGEYSVVCIDLDTGKARAASPLRVRGS